MALRIAPRFVELARHAVEGVGQQTKFVMALCCLAGRKVTGRNRLRTLGQNGQRGGQAAGQNKGDGHGGKQGEQHGEGQCHRVDARQPLPAERKLLIVPIDILHSLGVEG